MKVYVSIKLRYAIAKFDTMLWGLYAKSVYLVVIMSSKTSESEQKVKKSTKNNSVRHNHFRSIKWCTNGRVSRNYNNILLRIINISMVLMYMTFCRARTSSMGRGVADSGSWWWQRFLSHSWSRSWSRWSSQETRQIKRVVKRYQSMFFFKPRFGECESTTNLRLS